MCESQLDASSVRPSQNAWSAFSAVKSMKGSTTMEAAFSAARLNVGNRFQKKPIEITPASATQPRMSDQARRRRAPGEGLRAGPTVVHVGLNVGREVSPRLPGAISR